MSLLCAHAHMSKGTFSHASIQIRFSLSYLNKPISSYIICTEIWAQIVLRLNPFIKSFGTKFQTTLVVCFSFLTNYRLDRSLCVKLKD